MPYTIVNVTFMSKITGLFLHPESKSIYACFYFISP